ncbi:MAG: hypothetical protein N3A62_02305 [Thermodesulfovibrionales bacterium]|nr:hypothetical protein [Thermodesulfovibrionales bacterium]
MPRIDISKIKTYSLRDRQSKVSVDAFGKVYSRGMSFKGFVDSLPDFLAVKSLKALANDIVIARTNDKPVILGMGAHPIKVGLSPLIIDLIKSGIVTAFATNGAGIIHDFEIAYHGQTSEDVAREIDTGTFGMAQETAQFLNTAIIKGVDEGYGLGYSIGRSIFEGNLPYKHLSIFANCYEGSKVATVHVAIGTDIIHMHPTADGKSIGEGSLRDFRALVEAVSNLNGGVYINLGSSVILPEVFLKAITVARNLGFEVKDFTTANMDFIQHYRPTVNVLQRPTQCGGRHYALTGHHEIMFPLLCGLIKEFKG